MMPLKGNLTKMMNMTQGINQRWVLSLLADLSMGENIHDVTYYGGSVTKGRRRISIGRECSLYDDIPWKVIDSRHSGHLFRQEHKSRLGTNCQRTFNRVLHRLIRKGLLLVIPSETITQGQYRNIGNDTPMAPRQKHTEAVRFVILMPDAFGTFCNGITNQQN